MKLLGGEIKPGEALTVKGDLERGEMVFATTARTEQGSGAGA
jgi:hypothetical protein